MDGISIVLYLNGDEVNQSLIYDDWKVQYLTLISGIGVVDYSRNRKIN